jgi:microsomal dipeptidase-like Zn-dependent dipeptidase
VARIGRLIAAALTVASAWSASAAAESPYAFANRCVALRSVAAGAFVSAAGLTAYRTASRTETQATPFYLKPTGLGTYMLYDRDRELMSAPPLGSDTVTRTVALGRFDEWRLAPAGRGAFTLTSTAARRSLAVSSSGLLSLGSGRRLFKLAGGSGCAAFPEADIGASGPPGRTTNPDGTVFGFADYHLHITSNFRAGGRVIYGENFDPLGITAALSTSGDAQEHGPSGTIDFTGNLLRTGLPVGTHDNHGWPTFAGWPVHNTVTHQQVYWVWLERAWRAGLRLVVAQTVEDVELCEIEPLRSHSCDETASIKLQIQSLHGLQDYVDAQSGGPGRGWFRLVYSPQQARRVIEQGKLAVIIGVESSNPFGCSEFLGRPRCNRRDIDRGIAEYRRLGIRSFFIAHWVDNAFAGAAFEGGATGTFLNGLNKTETGQFFSAESCPEPGEGETMTSVGHYFPGHDPISRLLDTVQSESVPTYPPGPVCNAKGLTSLGRYLVTKMIANHMVIEADHLGEKARDTVLSIAAANDYPVISSHTGTGGKWPADQLQRLYAMGGLATARSDTAPNVVSKILELSQSRSPRFYFGVGLGTDTGGFNSQPGPRPDARQHPLPYPFTSFDGRVRFTRQRTGSRTFDINTDGIAHYGLIADLVADMGLQNDGATATSLLFRSAEAYLEMWQRAWDHT